MMKRVDIKAIILFLLINVFNVIEAAGWKESKSFLLQKDEQVKVLVKSEGQERLLNFRWTLYADKGLIVHENFDRFVGQHVLYTGHNQSFRKLLLNEKRTNRDVPYILVVFKKFDEGNKTAHMDLLLFDKESRVTLDYLTNK